MTKKGGAAATMAPSPPFFISLVSYVTDATAIVERQPYPSSACQ